MGVDRKEAEIKIRKLSPRLREVLHLYCQGYERKQIADKLGIKVNTVNDYFKVIYKRLGVDSDYYQHHTVEREEYIRMYYGDVVEEFIKSEGENEGDKERKKPPVVIDGEFVETDSTTTPSRATTIPRWIRGLVLILLALFAVFSLVTSYRVISGNPPLFLSSFFPATPTTEAVAGFSPTDTQAPATTEAFESATETNTLTPTPTPNHGKILPEVLPTFPTDTPGPSPTLTETPTPTEATIFEDAFDTGFSDKWIILAGDPMVLNGTLTTGNDVWMMTEIPEIKNYRVTFDLHLAGSCATIYSTFTPIIIDLDNYIGFFSCSDYRGWYIVKNGAGTVYGDGHFSEVHDVKVNFEVQGKFIKLYFGGKFFGSISDDMVHRGVGLKLTSGTWVDNFKIIQLP